MSNRATLSTVRLATRVRLPRLDTIGVALMLFAGSALTVIGLSGTAAHAQSVAIQNGKIITMAGEAIEKGTVVIEDGKISAVGPDASIPVEADIIDAAGKVVMPGFVEAHSSEPMSQANERNPNVPYVSVLDSIDPMRSYFEEARRNGVTTVAVVPGNSTMIGGKAAVIKTGGTFLDDMIVKRDLGMKMSLAPVGDSSRMGHLAALRKELEEARDKLAEQSQDSAGEGTNDDADDGDADDGDADDGDGGDADGEGEEDSGGDEQGGQDEAKSATPKPSEVTKEALDDDLLKVVAGEMPVFIYCEIAMDVGQALRLIDEFGLDPILVLGRDCYRAADLVASAGYPVILDSTLVYWETDPRTEEDEKIVLTEVFRRRGVEFVFQRGRSGNETLGRNYLWYQAATAVKYGMPVNDALLSLTKTPAEILGVEQFVGSLEVGKDGDVIILTGDPLRVGTWVETTIVNGEVVYERDEDRQLQLLLEGDSEN